jgi:hypothetical protein
MAYEFAAENPSYDKEFESSTMMKMKIAEGDELVTCDMHCGEGASRAIVPNRKRLPEPRHFSASFHSTPAPRDVATEHGVLPRQCEYE